MGFKRKLIALPLALGLALPTTLTGAALTVGSVAVVASLSACSSPAHRARTRQDARVENRVDARTQDRAEERVQDRKARRND